MADETEREEMDANEETIEEQEEDGEAEVETETEDSPGEEPEAEPKTPKPKGHSLGMIRAMQGERRKAQEARQESEELRKELGRLQRRQERGETEDADEILTKGELEDRLAEYRDDARTEQERKSERLAIVKHSVKKEGPGLDWESAADAFDELLAEDPALADVVLDSDDPAEKMYETVLKNHPVFIRRLAARGKTKLTRGLKGLAEDAVDTGGTSGAEPTRAAKDPYSMTTAELRKDLGLGED